MAENPHDTLSPRDFAAIIGVSESSIKRWVDAGRIPVTRTSGGHRRISRKVALAYIRDNEMPVLRPDLLGLGEVTVAAGDGSEIPSAEYLYDQLRLGNTQNVIKSVTAAFAGGVSCSQLFDGPLTGALSKVGTLWATSSEGIFIEHGSTSAIVELVARLGALLPDVSDQAPVAVGGSPPNDPHIIPSQMVATVLREEGWKSHNLGPRTPLYSFVDAAEQLAPQVVWIAAKSELKDGQRSGLLQLSSRLVRHGATVVVGGTAAVSMEWPNDVHVLNGMVELQELIRSIR